VPQEYKDLIKERNAIQEEWRALRKLKIENRAISELLKKDK